MFNPKYVAVHWEPRLLSILRIVVAVLFLQHGAQKLFGIPPMPQGISIQLMSLAGLTGVLEFFGGLLFLFGFFTRPVAFILSGEMSVAYFKSHAPQGFSPLMNHGELAVLFCFVFLYFAAAGGGLWSLDHVFLRER